VVLTDAGLAAMRQAEQIFQLGAASCGSARCSRRATVRLIVGISDELPKLAVQSLMQSVMQRGTSGYCVWSTSLRTCWVTSRCID
jgi:LysR family transcriptional activator of nhaA